MKKVFVVQIEMFYPEDTWHLSGVNVIFFLHVVFLFLLKRFEYEKAQLLLVLYVKHQLVSDEAENNELCGLPSQWRILIYQLI